MTALFIGFVVGAVSACLFNIYLLKRLKKELEKLAYEAKVEILKVEGLPTSAKHKAIEILNKL
jgi:uncharacterized membrane protein YgaE (UPF0421/DUF939 family)